MNPIKKFREWRRRRTIEKLVRVLNELAWAPYAEDGEIDIPALARKQGRLEKKLAKLN